MQHRAKLPDGTLLIDIGNYRWSDTDGTIYKDDECSAFKYNLEKNVEVIPIPGSHRWKLFVRYVADWRMSTEPTRHSLSFLPSDWMWSNLVFSRLKDLVVMDHDFKISLHDSTDFFCLWIFVTNAKNNICISNLTFSIKNFWLYDWYTCTCTCVYNVRMDSQTLRVVWLSVKIIHDFFS